MSLANFITIAKRTANIGNYATTTDQITADIVNYVNMRRQKMWRFANWSFGRKAFTLAMTGGVADYTLDPTIGKIEAISTGAGGILKRQTPTYYLKWLLDGNNGGTGTIPSYYMPTVTDPTTGALTIKLFPTPAAGASLNAYGIQRITVYAVSDIATNTAMDFFLLEHDDILWHGVLSDIYESQKLNDLSSKHEALFTSLLNACMSETENTPDLSMSLPLPALIKANNRARRGGGVC